MWHKWSRNNKFRSQASSHKMCTACSQLYGRHLDVCTASVSLGPETASCYVFHHSTADSLCACTGRLSTQFVYPVRSISMIENLYSYAFLKTSSTHHCQNLQHCSSPAKWATSLSQSVNSIFCMDLSIQKAQLYCHQLQLVYLNFKVIACDTVSCANTQSWE